MYCTKCGKRIPDDSRLCPLCGCDLSYESNAVRNAPASKKPQRRRKSRLPGILVVLALILAAAECVYLIGYAPVHIVPGTADGATAGGPDGAGAAASGVSSGEAGSASGADGTSEADSADGKAEAGAAIVDLVPTAASVTAVPEAPAATEAPTPTPVVTPIAGATVNPAAVVPPTAENFTQEVTPTPAVDPGVPISSSQMLPNSATEEISTSQLDNMTAEEIRIARNEIYARHGLIFQAEDLNEYFSAQDWYQGTVNDTDSITLSEIEAKNVAIIVAYEDAMDAD